MMNIYIIGNGFDLDLGYDTSYKSFLLSDEFKILIQNNSDNNLAKFIYQYHHDDIDNWVDVEVILGKYVNEICDQKPDVLYNDFKELKNQLKAYLNDQNNKFIKTEEGNKRSFRFLQDMITDLNDNKESVLVNFNFTNTVLGRLKRINGGIIERKYFNYFQPHGTLSTDIAFGINEGFLNSESSRYSFIKKGYSESYNLRGWESLFKKASKISIFGHSLGITDIDIIGPMFKYFLNNPDENRKINIYDHQSANQIVTSRVESLVEGRINTFKLTNNLFINPY